MTSPKDSLLAGLTSLFYIIDRDKDSDSSVGSVSRSPDLHSIDSRELVFEVVYKANFCDLL